MPAPTAHILVPSDEPFTRQTRTPARGLASLELCASTHVTSHDNVWPGERDHTPPRFNARAAFGSHGVLAKTAPRDSPAPPTRARARTSARAARFGTRLSRMARGALSPAAPAASPLARKGTRSVGSMTASLLPLSAQHSLCHPNSGRTCLSVAMAMAMTRLA